MKRNIYGTRKNDWRMHASNSRNWEFETHRNLGRLYDTLCFVKSRSEVSFKKDIKLLKVNAGNVLVPRAEHFLKSFLKDKPLPMSSAKYMAQQACYIQSLRYIFRQVMFRQVFRQASQILSVLQLNEKLVYKSPEISQATALEENDLEIETVTSTKIPEADGTIVYAYLTLGVIDALSLQQENSAQELKPSVTSTIISFPKFFHKYRTTTCMVNVYKPYELLLRNHSLKHNFEFIENFTDNEKVFSNEIQMKLSKELSSLSATAVENKIRHFAIVQTEKYILCRSISSK